MNKKHLYILIFLLVAPVFGAYSQQPNGIFWVPELRLNPALTGVMTGKWRLMEHHRNQTLNSGMDLNWNTISADFRKDITKKAGGYGLVMDEATGNTFGFGVMDNRLRSDSSGVEYTADYFSFSYRHAFKKSTFGFGLQPGYMRADTNRKFDFNAGLLWGKGSIACWQEDQVFKNQIGIAAYNILSDWSDTTLMPGREIQVHAGFLIKKIEQFNFVANAMYRYNGTSDFSIGTYAMFFPIVHYAYWDRARLGLHYRSSNHLTCSAGLRLYGRGRKTFTLDGTISYDLPMKFLDFESKYKHAWEIGIVITRFEKCWSTSKCGN